jgi:hypothetical protein
MGKTKTERTEMTCDLSDAVDFIGSALLRAESVKVTIDGAEWTVTRGGPTVTFEYLGETITY